MENTNETEFIGQSPSHIDFLQSAQWRKFQEAVGRRTFSISFPSPPASLPEGEGGIYFNASIIEHRLPVVGKYFYIPRGPIIKEARSKKQEAIERFLELIRLAKKEKAGWIRFDASNIEGLNLIKKSINSLRPRRIGLKIRKAPHDMQPKEIFIIDISKPEEQLLAEMKAKTRYNIKLSQKRGVSVKVISNFQFPISKQTPSSNDQISKNYADEFIRLVKLTAERNKTTSHPEEYYRKMFEIIPGEILKLYVAEYENKIIAANLMIFYGDTAIYLHGASDNEYRNVMAPYLLQWRAIQDAKKAGCIRYDFGGINTEIPNLKSQISSEIPMFKFQKFIKNLKFKIKNSSNGWQGITKFKTGFSPNTQPIEFPGSYDIVINPIKYWIYRMLQKMKSFI